MRPKRKSRIETERKIFEAGLSIFSKYGFETASLKQIAKIAGVNEALIIRYYKSKAKLLTDIMVEYFKKQDQAAGGLPEYSTLEEEIREFFLREIRSDFENRDFVRIILARVCVDPKMRRDIAVHWKDEGSPELTQRLKKFQEKGDISESVDLTSLSYLLQMETLGFGLAIRLLPNLDQELIESRATIFATIIARGLQTEKT